MRVSFDGLTPELASATDGSSNPSETQVPGRDSAPPDLRSASPDASLQLDSNLGQAGSTGTGGSGGSTGGEQDASAVDTALAIDSHADRTSSVDTRANDSAQDLREAGRDSPGDGLVPLDASSQDADAGEDDASGASLDALVILDGARDVPFDAPAPDADLSPDVQSEASAGSCPTVSAARQYDVTSMGGLALDGTGHPIIAAKLFGSVDFGAGAVTSAGSADLLIAKLDPVTLTATWSKSFSGTGESSNPTDQIPLGVAVSHSGQIGVVGNFTGNMVVNSGTTLNGGGSPIDFVMATDGAGTGLWGKVVDTQSGGLVSIAGHSARDELVVCGYAMGPVTALGLSGTYGDTSDNPLEDILIAKLNAATGAVVWARQIGGVGSQLCSAVAMDATGVVYAAGSYNGTLDFGTGALPSLASSVQAIWVAKLDGADGHALAAKKYGTAARQSVKGIAVDGNGHVAITGNLKGSLVFGSTTLVSGGGTDGYLAKLDGNLDPIWAKSWGDSANQESNRVAFTSNGDLLVVGYLKGSAHLGGSTLTSAGLSDALWAKFNANGESLCAAVYGDADRDQVASTLAVSGETVLAAGFSSGTITFAPGLSLTSTTPKGFLFVLP